MNVSGLADTVTSVLALLVHCWIPVLIVEDDGISTSKIDTETTGPRGEDKAEDPIVVVEPVREYLALLNLCRAVETEVLVPMDVEELFQDVQDLGHLSKYQNRWPPGLEFAKKPVQGLQLPAVKLEQTSVRELDAQSHA